MAETNARRGVLAIGNLLVDKTFRMAAFPRESMLAVIERGSIGAGGGAANALFDLAAMDPALPLSVAGLIGDDEDGRFLKAEFASRSIDTAGIGVVADKPTSFTHVMVSETAATRTFFHAHGANSRLTLDRFREIGGTAKIAHLAYLMLLEGLDVEDPEFGSGGAAALAILRAKGFRVSLDLVSVGDAEVYKKYAVPALPHVDYLIVNEVEAAGLTGLPPAVRDDGVDWEGAFVQTRKLLDLGVNELVAIHFPEGSVAELRDGTRVRHDAYHVPKTEVVSPLGAGDAFCAGMLYGLHEGFPLEDCLRLAAASARANLFSATAAGGAESLADLKATIARFEGKRA